MVSKFIYKLADGTIEGYCQPQELDHDGKFVGAGGEWVETEQDYGRDRLLAEAERHPPSEEDLQEVTIPDGMKLIGVIENVFNDEEAEAIPEN